MNLRDQTIAAFGERADVRRSKDRAWWHVFAGAEWRLSISADCPNGEGIALTVATAIEIAPEDLEHTLRPLAGLSWLHGSHAIGGRGAPTSKHPEGEPRAWLPPHLPELAAWVRALARLGTERRAA